MNIRKFLNGIAGALALACQPAYAGTNVAVSVNPASLTRTFTSSTTDTVPSWATGAFVTMQAGGGGGAVGTNTNGAWSGDAWRDVYTPVTPGATLTITIGAGGGSGANGGNTSVTGTTYLLPTACGGSSNGGGAASPCGNQGNRPYLGPGSNNNWYVSTMYSAPIPNYIAPMGGGSSNQTAFTCPYGDGTVLANPSNGSGGCSMFGRGGLAVASGTGGNATGFGAGGGAGSVAGGSGSPGLVIIRYVQ